MSSGKNGKINVDKELEKIEMKLPYLDNIKTWEAFLADPAFDDLLDDETFVVYAKDAADAANRVRYDADYLTFFNSVVEEYRGLLEKYHYPEELMEESVYIMTVSFLEGRVVVFRQVSINEGGAEEIPEMPEGDIDNYTMAMIFANLPPQPEIAAYLKKINVNFDYDHLHMVTWFSAQMNHGKGNYSRTEHNFSAKTTYNRLLNPYSLMWIAAALGEEREVVEKAAAEAEKVRSFASKCGAVRKEIPFSRILELADAMYDELFPETEEEE